MTASKRMRRNSLSNARVSGSELGAVPRYVSLPVSVFDPSSSWFQYVGKLRLRSTPSTPASITPSPLLSRRFLRQRRLPGVKV